MGGNMRFLFGRKKTSWLALSVLIFVSSVVIFNSVYNSWWVIRNAIVYMTPEGIAIYDARRGEDRKINDWFGLNPAEAVDNTFDFLKRCVPLDEREQERIRGAAVVIRSVPLQHPLIWKIKNWAGYHSYYVNHQIHVAGYWSISHEWLHVFLNPGLLDADFWRKFFRSPVLFTKQLIQNLTHTHPLFEKCEYPVFSPKRKT